ncbi:PAS domain-containing protein [Chloroflexota bacterium]
MKDKDKTKEQLNNELTGLRHRIAELEAVEIELKRAETALWESEQRYKRLLELVTDYVYTVKVENDQSVATSHGPNCVELTGCTAQEYEANPYLWYQMVYEEDREAVTEQAARVLSGEETLPLEHRLIHKDGSIRWIRNTIAPRYNKQGHLVAYDGLIVDITERIQVEEEIRRRNRELTLLNQAIEQTIESVIITDN